jgi:hypothetical protein
MCSDLPEADHVAMPMGSAKDSGHFAPLTYYKLSVPVVPLPRALNDEAERVASQFLEEATQRLERFLAIPFKPSYKTLDWIADKAARTHNVRTLGVLRRDQDPRIYAVRPGQLRAPTLIQRILLLLVIRADGPKVT